MTDASVESTMIGVSTLIEMSLTSFDICSASSPRSVSATQTSSTCAPESCWSRATSRIPS